MNRESRVVIVAFFCGSKMEGEGIGGTVCKPFNPSF